MKQDENIKNKWFKYLSDQENDSLVQIMENYFNDRIDFDTLNNKVIDLDLISFRVFKKGIMMDDLLMD